MNSSLINSSALAEHADRLIAQDQIHQDLEAQIEQIAPEAVDPDAARIRLIKLHQVREATNEGEYFWRKKQSFPKLK